MLPALDTKSAIRKGYSIHTYSSGLVWPLDLREDEISIEDIAHSLSMLCRYNGHLEKFYSVAQHSVLVSGICTSENQLWGLLHDASEAYISDLPSPIKAQFPEFKQAELLIQKAICNKYGLTIGEPPEVKKADMVIRATEMRDLLGLNYSEYQPIKEKITPWTQEFAKQAYLDAFETLKVK